MICFSNKYVELSYFKDGIYFRNIDTISIRLAYICFCSNLVVKDLECLPPPLAEYQNLTKLRPCTFYINWLDFYPDFKMKVTELLLPSNLNKCFKGIWFQRSIYSLNKISLDYNMKISISKTKSMVFKDKEPVGTKLVINNKPIEQIQHFTYLGCDITYDYDPDLQK